MPLGIPVISDDFLCPRCGERIVEAIFVHWGRSAHYEYRVGDEFEWLKLRNGGIRKPYRSRWDDRYNVGAPTLAEFILLCVQNTPYSWDDKSPNCPQCGLKFDAVGVRVKENRIVGAEVFAEGQLAGVRDERGRICDVIEVHGDELIARFDLVDQPLEKEGS